MPEPIRLNFFQSPGDTLVATGAVEALVRQHPGRYTIDVTGTDVEAIFENNPHITFGAGGRLVPMHNPFISECDKRPVHFLDSYCHQLSKVLQIPLTCVVNRPYFYLSAQEKSWISQVQEITGERTRYWVVNSGTKTDYTIKSWGRENYQRVVNLLWGEVQFVQVGLREHLHPPLNGVIDLRGKTDTRQLIRLCWNAVGGLGGESFNNHVFAAMQKPFVSVLSGFLPSSWVAYPTTYQFHKAKLLSCCDRTKGACWKSRVVKLNDGDEKDNRLCALPVVQPGCEPIAKCMALVTPEEVADVVREFHQSNG